MRRTSIPATRSKSASQLGKLRGVSSNPRRTPSSKSAPASMGTSRKATKNKASKSKGKRVQNGGFRANNSNNQLGVLIYPGDISTLDSHEFPFHFATINRANNSNSQVLIYPGDTLDSREFPFHFATINRANNSNGQLLIYPGDSSTLDPREFPFHFATINRTKRVPIITPSQIIKNYFASRR